MVGLYCGGDESGGGGGGDRSDWLCCTKGLTVLYRPVSFFLPSLLLKSRMCCNGLLTAHQLSCLPPVSSSLESPEPIINF